MNKKKNNAVEKVEKTAKKVSEKNGGNDTKKTTARQTVRKASSPKTDKERLKAQRLRQKKEQKELKEQEKAKLKAEKLRKKQERRTALEQELAERDRIQAQKRIELARIKAHKKAEREKARATALRERENRIATLKAQREGNKAKKLERREMIKHETKKQRQIRIAKEKALKQQIKQQKIQARKEEQQRIREENRLKRQERAKRREKNRGFGGWLAAVISLGVSTLVLASVLTFTLVTPSREENLLESSYLKSFYETSTQVNNMDVNLSKVLASNDNVARQGYLTDIAVESELAQNNIQQLPLSDENKFYTTKIINQIGDYSKALNKKLAGGEDLTEDDERILISLYESNQALKKSLSEVTKQANGNFNFVGMANGDTKNFVTENFTKLQNISVDYPELIYDGPFSDGKDNRAVKGLGEIEVTQSEAVKVFTSAFDDYGLTDISANGETSGLIQCINVVAQSDKGEIYGQVSKKGGKLIMFSLAGDCNSVEFTHEHCIETARKFLTKIGFSNMQAVWYNLAENVYTINFVYTESGIPVYSDMVKIRVCAQTDTVLGLEAQSYYTNHTSRTVPKPKVALTEASKKVSKNIEIQNARLAIIPVGTLSEKLCYEFMGVYDGATYYVYIDAMTGRQVEMFKVVESTEGTLLV